MIKVLTIKQPWAWAIFCAGKNIENRSRNTNFRGRLYIHASKLNFELCGTSKGANDFDDALRSIGKVTGIKPPKSWRFDPSVVFQESAFASGAIIGHVDLVDVRSPQEKDDGWHMAGHYGWVFENQTLLKSPIYCRGQLGIWNYEGEIQ